MDNVAHSLVGIAIADASAQGRFRRVRNPALLTSLVANNFPDLDILYAKAISGPYGYVLHHRGHTHTIIAGIAQAMLLLLAIWLFARWRKLRLESIDWIYLGALSLFGMWVHVGLDSLNSYGVHPFWPFSNRWYYQDAVFIVEPWFLLSLGIFLGFAAQTRWAKIFCWGIVAGILALEFGLTAAPLPVKFAYSICAVLFWLAAARCPLPLRSTAALALVVAFAMISSIATRVAKAEISSASTRNFPTEQLDEVVTTPKPGNPLCLDFFTVSLDEKQDLFIVRKGSFTYTTMLPGCLDPGSRLHKVSWTKPEDSGATRMEWRDEHSSSLSFLRQNARSEQNCHFAAFLRFSRLPFLTVMSSGEMAFGDWRYEGRARPSFAKFQARLDSPCPTLLPPWTPPRAKALFPRI